MASIPIILNDWPSHFQEKWNFHIGKSKCLTTHSILSYSGPNFSTSNSAPLIGLSNRSCKSRQRLLLPSTEVRSLINDKRNLGTHFRERDSNGMRKRHSMRLRPRLRLLTWRLKRFSVRLALNNGGTFLRKNMRMVLSISVSFIFGLCYLFLKLTAMPSPKVVPYSDLVMNLQSGSVTKVQFEEGSRRILYNIKTTEDNIADDAASSGRMSSDQVGKNVLYEMSRASRSAPVWQFSTRKVDHDEGYLLSLMREQGTASYGSAPQSALTSMRSLLVTVLTLWIPLTPLMWLLYRQVSAASTTTARKRRSASLLVDFSDVEGVDTAKMELMEIVMCLQGSINYSKLGAKLPKGVLLVGPPGTGKTLLARAVAGEAGVPFYSVSASEFVELYVGKGASRVRELFKVARKNSPSIIFIDELDAVGGKRGRSFNDERDQTLNQLLTEMDGFESDTNVIVIAATNRPEALDAALCRPGRFSRKVLVGEPDENGRRKILAVHLRGVPLEEDMGLICSLVASLTQGFVGADLANIVNEAALLAARRGSECVSREDIMDAIERAKCGIDHKQSQSIGKELGKLFPWVPSLMKRKDGLQVPSGYQTLS
ncbi:unnamed protein product [Cuscuta europaea]|uniref:AAA+ ATPase domain-containing protein n=1 Tax=Cuscuta europaea TaxID=41803 RepID=A0A9P0YLY9_CUSEU|nr:unnamed protein product [Cuscuta europaea]